MIGSVLLHRAWQAAQRLGPLAQSDRPPFLCLVDECHRFCHLPQGMASALAQARGYGLGFVLAHQHLAQVSDHGLVEAIDANCQTKICFALQATDAKRMAPHFQPRLDAYDLQHLGSYTIACRVLHDARGSCPPRPPRHSRRRSPRRVTLPGRSASAPATRRRSTRRWRPRSAPAMAGSSSRHPVGCRPMSSTRECSGSMLRVLRWALAPSDGAPPPPVTPHHDSDPGSWANPDNEQFLSLPGGGYEAESPPYNSP